MDAWLILLPAFVMTALMVITHTYFGLHILARGIIFADLALAQMAALGASVAFLVGVESHSANAQVFAFIATFVAAAAFSQLRRIKDATTREVTIGVVYVVSTALSIVILSRSSQGMEELKAIFNGNILWVSWEEISIIALVYVLVGFLHFIFRKSFFELSYGDVDKEPSYLWEFFFFLSFAIVITMAVGVAGVLLVFAFLIIPAFSASLMFKVYRLRLLLGWLLGILGSIVGLFLAFMLDLPVGATVVSLFGLLPILALAVSKLNKYCHLRKNNSCREK